MSTGNPVRQKFGDLTVSDFIENSVASALEYTRGTRKCPELEDSDFIFMGITKMLGEEETGRGFIQKIQESHSEQFERHHWFEALHSKRRLEMLREFYTAFGNRLQQEAVSRKVDYLEDFPQLQGRMVIAADGHYHEHPSHCSTDIRGKYVPPGTIYAMDLHTGLINPLAIVQTQGVRNHEIKALRESLRRLNPGKNPRPLVIYDMAIQDNRFFAEMKLNRTGVDIITRMKQNIIPVFKEPVAFDNTLPANAGVTGDYCVGMDNSVCLRMIEYTDPESGTEYTFLTTDEDLAPGIIAWLYRLRWRIEKAFDIKKNKLRERKAWANGETAQEIQDIFTSLAINILAFFLRQLTAEHGIDEKKLHQKRENWLRQRELKARENQRELHPLVRTTRHMYQISAQFIRCVRNHLFSQVSILSLLPRFSSMLSDYL